MEKLALSVKEAAELLGLSERTVREMAREGRIPFKRIVTGRGSRKGGRIIIPRAALEAWLAAPDEAPAERSLRLAWERETVKRARKAAKAAARASKSAG